MKRDGFETICVVVALLGVGGLIGSLVSPGVSLGLAFLASIAGVVHYVDRSQWVAQAEALEPGMDDYLADQRRACVRPDGSVADIDRTSSSYWPHYLEAQSRLISERDQVELRAKMMWEATSQQAPWESLTDGAQDYYRRIARNRINSASAGRDECGGPSEQVGNSSHSVTGLARGAGAVGLQPEGASTPARVSGEAVDHE